jgi:hypothetical protein
MCIFVSSSVRILENEDLFIIYPGFVIRRNKNCSRRLIFTNNYLITMKIIAIATALYIGLAKAAPAIVWNSVSSSSDGGSPLHISDLNDARSLLTSTLNNGNNDNASNLSAVIFQVELVSEEDYEAALCGHQAAVDATKSQHRDKAYAFNDDNVFSSLNEGGVHDEADSTESSYDTFFVTCVVISIIAASSAFFMVR